MAGVSNYEITEIDHALSANTVILRVTELDENGESVGGPTYSQLGIEGIIGSPDGRALGSLGDIRIRIDVPQIWQKTSGPPRSRTGWTLVGGGGGVALCSSLPQSLAAGSAGSAGIDGEASRCDHSHPVPVATPITVQGGTNFVGASGSLARADHQHRLELNVEQDGIAVGSRPTINLIGATVTDDGPNDRVDITLPTSQTVVSEGTVLGEIDFRATPTVPLVNGATTIDGFPFTVVNAGNAAVIER